MTEGGDLVARAFSRVSEADPEGQIRAPGAAPRHAVLPAWSTYARREAGWRVELCRIEAQIAMAVRAIEPSVAVTSRLKSFPSAWRKIVTHDSSLDALHDVLGLRIIVDREPACYEVLAAILVSWPGASLRVRDYIAHPKPNGYRSIHVVLRAPAGPSFEVQIRTRRMQEESERGPAAHWRYKRTSEQLAYRAAERLVVSTQSTA
jgi:GTP pyrophosphokinase